MKKRVFLLSLALLFGVSRLFAWDFEHVKIGDLYYNLDHENQLAEVTYEEWGESNYPTLTGANIPSSITYMSVDYSVNSIGLAAFYSSDNLTSVTIPSSVKNISVSAFNSCPELKIVTIEEGVTTIGNQAFAYCEQLSSINIPNSVISVGELVFIQSNNLVNPLYNTHIFMRLPTSYSGNYTVQEGIENITHAAFFQCENLTSLVLPESLIKIDKQSLDFCNNIESITCAATTPPEVGNNVFINIDKSIPVYVPEQSISIYQEADQWRDFLNIQAIDNEEQINTPVSGRYKIDDVYYDLKGESKTATVVASDNKDYSGHISIPNSVVYDDIVYRVVSIGKNAFFYCKNLLSIEIAEGILSIEDGAFCWCENLNTVTLHKGIMTVGKMAFNLCASLQSITFYEGLLSIGIGAFERCWELTSICLPNSLETLGEDTFNYCDKLRHVTLGTSVHSIEKDYFSNMSFGNVYSLEDLTIYTTIPPKATLGYNNSLVGDFGVETIYVPGVALRAYKDHEVWGRFNVQPIPGTEIAGQEINVKYLDENNSEISREFIIFNFPDAPTFSGFSFIGWQTNGAIIENELVLRAVYKYDVDAPTSAPSVITNPANPAQKLIRNGSVYILTDDSRTYTLTGQQVK